jgi:hypothetical protein
MKTFQKKLFLLFPLFLFCLSIATDALAKPKLHIVITTKYKGQDCQTEGGWCISISTWGDRLISIPGGATDPAGRNAELQVSDDGRTATLVFTESKSPVKFSVFEVAADVVLTPEVARGLGCNSVVLLKGNYQVDYSKSRNGVIVFNTRIQ